MLSTLERRIRMIGGVAIVMLGGIKANFLVGIIGLIILATGLYNFCPVYKILKINSGDKNKK